MNGLVREATRVSLRPLTMADHAWLDGALPRIRRTRIDDETWSDEEVHTRVSARGLGRFRARVDAPNARSLQLLARPGVTETHRSMGHRNPLRHHERGREGLRPAT